MRTGGLERQPPVSLAGWRGLRTISYSRSSGPDAARLYIQYSGPAEDSGQSARCAPPRQRSSPASERQDSSAPCRSPRQASRSRANRLSSSSSPGSPGNHGCVMRHSSSDLGRSACLRSEEHTSELQSHSDLVCRLLLEKKKKNKLKYIKLSQITTYSHINEYHIYMSAQFV